MKKGKLVLAAFLVTIFVSLPCLILAADCQLVSSLPAVITSPGVHCLGQNMGFSSKLGHAITINADNVTLDMKGFLLNGSGAGADTNAFGIYSTNHRNITIKDGTVKGFYYGIYLSNSPSAIIEGIRADSNKYIAIAAYGNGNIIRHNVVVNTGGSTIVTSYAYGVIGNGSGVRIIDNDVYGLTLKATSGYLEAIGIQASGNSIVVEKNRVGTTAASTSTIGIIARNPGSNVLIVNNRITNMYEGVYYSPDVSGKYRDNLTIGATFPYVGGTDAGNNQ